MHSLGGIYDTEKLAFGLRNRRSTSYEYTIEERIETLDEYEQRVVTIVSSEYLRVDAPLVASGVLRLFQTLPAVSRSRLQGNSLFTSCSPTLGKRSDRDGL